MGTEALLTVVGGFVLAGVGYVVLLVVGDIAADEAKEAVFRRASFAARRSRHRTLMKTGFVCAMLAFLVAIFWPAVTSGREDDAEDARTFAILTAVIALAAGGLLTTWWRRAGRPQNQMDDGTTSRRRTRQTSGVSMSLPSIPVDQSTQLVPPTIGCLLGLTAIADEVSERWITPRRDREVMRRWLGRIIERNEEGQIARFCIHREGRCAGVVGFSSLDPVRMSWWVGPQWRGTGLAEASCRAVLAWLASTRAVTVVEAAVDPDNLASMALAKRLGFHDAGSITKRAPDTGHLRQRRRLALTYRPLRAATPPQVDPVAST